MGGVMEIHARGLDTRMTSPFFRPHLSKLPENKDHLVELSFHCATVKLGYDQRTVTGKVGLTPAHAQITS